MRDAPALGDFRFRIESQGRNMKSVQVILLLLLGATLNLTHSAQVVYLKGKAWSTSPGSLDRKTVRLNQTLQAGDQIRTSSHSSITLKLNEKVTIKVQENSKFFIPKRSSSKKISQRLDLAFGNLWFSVKKLFQGEKFEVKTPTATAGVRGTEFSVGHDQDSGISKTSVFDGSVFAQNLMGEMKILEEGMISQIGDDIHKLVKEELAILDEVLDFKAIPLNSSKKAHLKTQKEMKELELELREMGRRLSDEMLEKQERMLERIDRHTQELMKDLEKMEKEILRDAEKLEKDMLEQGKQLEKNLLKQSDEFQKNLMKRLQESGVPGLGGQGGTIPGLEGGIPGLGTDSSDDEDDDDDDDWDMGTDDGDFLDDME